MADVNANIGINFDTSQALAQLRQLQAGLSRFNQTLTQGNVAAMQAQKGLNSQLMQAINATGKFVATQKDVATSTSSFTQALEKNQMSMRQYFRYTAAAATQNTKVFKGMFAQERETLTRASKDRVKLLQSQYIQLQAANGNMIKTLQVIPKHLKMVNGQYTDYATRMQMAAQRQQFLNKLLSQGSTQLLNFGKNTQWAGRQLMVGLTIPLTILGSTAAKTFMEMEQAITKFSRVYGDMMTNSDATDKAIADIQRLGKEFTKYGIAVKDTVEMAASAAAMGLTGDALSAQVVQATRLAVLGQVEQQQALETTISLTNAFGIASADLAKKINFLNAVENQTVLSIEDLTIAIPKAGPVVKQLGGSVEDLAFFMTAMKEGGINASEGANALKSGLASMINPSKKASEFLMGLGINIKGLVEANKGDLKGTVVGFARALDELDPLNRARAIEQMFGKFQFARLSTLFQNVTKDSSQAARALGLAGASVEELAILSERELGKVEDMTGNKFKKSMENLKLQLIPIGKAFLQAVTPIVNFVGRILEKFNTLSDGTKKVITVIVGVIGGLAPVALMTFGVLMNAVANGIKLFAKLRGGIAQLNGSNNVLGGGFEYLTNEQLENVAQANALHTSHSQLISTFNVEAASVQALAAAYGTAASQARALAQSSPGLFNTVPGPIGAVSGLPPTKFATGGVVPGTGNKDTVPALLTPGEVVITKDTAKANPELVAALQNGSVNRYHKGTGEFHEHPHPRKPKYTITEPHTGRVAGGEQNTKTMSGGAIMMPGNIQGRPVTGSTVAGGDSRFIANTELNDDGELIPTGATDSFKAATAGSMKTQMQALDGIKRQTDESFAIWSESNKHLSPHFDEMANIFAKEIVPGVTDVSQAGQNAYPKMVAYIDSLERDLKITAAEAEKMKISARRIFDADLGTPESPGQDAVAMNRKRVETGIDADGNERITDIRTERVALPGHSMSEYLDGKTKENTDREYALRGLTPPEETDEKGSKPTFAHIKSGEAGPSYLDPIASEKGGVTDTERAIVEKLRNRERLSAGQIITPAPTVEVPPEDIATAEAAGAEVGQAVIDGAEGPDGVDKGSPSKKGRKIGKSVADGIVEGLQEGTPEVTAQSSRLGDAAVPTEAETRAKVDKMDLDNKAFYDDIDTPEFRDQRQILKSQDRHRRKMGATGNVGGGPGTPPVSGPSSVTVSSTAKTAEAAEQLAVSTEQAATAQSQVVQQIHDESKSRVTIKGNTINIGKARQEADRLDKEASDAEAAAAKIRSEAAKWEEVAAREKGKNMQTAENAKALKKQADEAEIRAAEARIKAAEAEIVAAQLESDEGVTEQIIQDPVKTPAKVKKAEEIMSNGTVEAGDGMRRIVDGTDETADSTLLVAEQTDELASVTGEAIDAQTQTADNLLTGAQITDATTGNMNDVLQSTDMTGTAQGDIADSSENIADINRDIEEDKRKIRTLGQQELAARMKDPGAIIPDGAQSDTKRFDRANAPDLPEAYDEVMGRDPGTKGPDDKGQVGYTRDKKGHFLFDPETKQPTTLTEKQLGKKKRGMRKEKVGKMSGKAAGALGMATMAAGAMGAPPQVTAALGTAATVAQFAPMIAGLSGPQGVVVGIAALAAGAYMLNKHFNTMAAKAAQFATDLSATRDGLKSIGEMAGRVGASEMMDKRRSTSQYGKYDEEIKIDNTFGNKFLGTDVGKKEKKLFQDNAKKFGSSKAVDDLSLKLAMAVADGVLDAQAANSIAAELALQLKDQKIEMQIVGQLSALLGPNGEDLKNSPMDTRALLMANANNRVNETEADIASGKGNTRENVASVAAYNMNNIQMATMLADQIQVEYETQKKKLEAELAATANAAKKLAIEQQISALTAQNLLDTNAMNAMLLTQIGLQQKSFDKVFSNSRWGSQAAKEDAYFDGTRNQLATNYKGTDQEEASKTFLNTSESFSSGDFSAGANQKTIQSFQAKWEMLVGSKVLSPSEANNYLELFSGQLNNLDLLFNASVELHGTSKTKELLNMFGGYQDKKMATNMVTQIALTKTDPAQFDAIMEALKGIQALDGTTIDMEVLLTTLGLEGLDVLKGQMEGIEKLKEEQKKKGDKKIDLEAAKKLGPQENAAITALQANEARYKDFNALNLEQQAEYLQKLQTQFAYESILNEDQKSAAADLYARTQAWLAQSAGTIAAGADALLEAEKKFKAAFLKLTPAEMAAEKLKTNYASGVTSIKAPVVPTGGDKGKKDDPLDFLDSLAMRIKMVRDQAFNAKKPIESMLAAFTSPAAQKNVAKMFSLFDGVQQKLIALQVPEEFRDYIAGLDAEQFDALMKADLNSKKKGQQGVFTYGAKKKKGKVVKDAKGNIVYDKSRIVGLSAEGEAVVAAYNEAPLDKFNTAQSKVITDTDKQFKAFTKLKAAGVDTATALEMVADTALAGAIASKQYDAKEIEEFAKHVKNAADATEKAAVMADLLKKNADFEFKAEAVPKLAAALKQTGMSVENIQTVLSDPALAKQLIKDLADGKIDSQAIADYLKNIKDEKIVEIRGKFNAGDFAGAAAPGMELVNKMFSVQEALIRTGASAASNGMVASIKKLKNINEDLQLEIQEITFKSIRPIEMTIEKLSRDLEMKVTRVIEAYQEEVSDLQHVIELAFEDPIAIINEENTIMSEDMNIMNHAAEEINKRYDEQAEALAKVSEIKSRIVEQEKEQLDLADALSKGDIGAAARAIQAIRAAQAARNAENASKALELSRKNKIDNLRGEVSGLSKDEITERQYQNAKATYALENTVQTEVINPDGSKELLTRLQILDKIKDRNRDIYKLEEDREARQLAIRAEEDKIYAFKQEIEKKQYIIDENNLSIATDERAIEKLVSNITVLGKTKDAWDAVGAKIDASALAGQDFDRLMGSMLASVDKIEEGWKNIEKTLGTYSGTVLDPNSGLGTILMEDERKEFHALLAKNEKAALDAIEIGKTAMKQAQDKYDIAKKAYDLEVLSLETQHDSAMARKDFFAAEKIYQALVAKRKMAPVAPITGPNSAVDNATTDYNDPTKNTANDIYKTGNFKGPTTSDAGGKATTGGSGSGTGGSGTGGSGASNVGPGQNPPTNTTNANTPPVKPPVLKPTMATAQDKANVKAGTYESLMKEKDRAEKIRDNAKKALKDFGGYGITTKDNSIYKTTMDLKDREKFDVLYTKYQDAYNYAESFRTQADGGKNDKYVEKTKGADKVREDAIKKLPQWVQDALNIINGSHSKFIDDYSKLQAASASYIKEAEKHGVETRTFASLKGTKYEALMKPRHDQIQAQFKKMLAENDIVDNARASLLKNGFGDLQNWAIGTTGGWHPWATFSPYTPSSGLTIDNIGDRSGKRTHDPIKGYATGGFVSSKFAQNKFKMGTDTVPAMLTPGEFVMNKFAVQTHGIGKMQAMNNGQSAGDSVYNYSISVNVKSESNPDEIARTVIAQIKSVDAQKMRGVRT